MQVISMYTGLSSQKKGQRYANSKNMLAIKIIFFPMLFPSQKRAKKGKPSLVKFCNQYKNINKQKEKLKPPLRFG